MIVQSVQRWINNLAQLAQATTQTIFTEDDVEEDIAEDDTPKM